MGCTILTSNDKEVEHRSIVHDTALDRREKVRAFSRACNPSFFASRRKPSNPTPPPHSRRLSAPFESKSAWGWHARVRSCLGCALRMRPLHGVRGGVGQVRGRPDVEFSLFWGWEFWFWNRDSGTRHWGWHTLACVRAVAWCAYRPGMLAGRGARARGTGARSTGRRRTSIFNLENLFGRRRHERVCTDDLRLLLSFTDGDEGSGDAPKIRIYFRNPSSRAQGDHGRTSCRWCDHPWVPSRLYGEDQGPPLSAHSAGEAEAAEHLRGRRSIITREERAFDHYHRERYQQTCKRTNTRAQ